MSQSDDVFERSVFALVSRMSGTAVTLLVLILYPGIGLILPLVLAIPTFWLVLLNLLGVVMALVFLVGWLELQLQAGHRRHLLEWHSDLRLLNSSEFEWLVGEVLRREGWTVRETGRHDGPDGNVDLELNRAGERRIVQCKRWTARSVGVDEIRRFLGTLMSESLPGSAGVFVTLSTFGEQARQEATRAGLNLIDGRELQSRIEKVRRSEPCPLCGSPMKLDHSRFGWWLRCATNGCSGKRDLSDDPGRAVRHLMASEQ